jgi:hypothetical protein
MAAHAGLSASILKILLTSSDRSLSTEEYNSDASRIK